jgi:hypothetical protein
MSYPLDMLASTIKKPLLKVYYFYYDGFKAMTVGKRLWIIILLKLFIMFVILKVFFFKDFLKTNFNDDESRSKYVLEELTQSNNPVKHNQK